jgi:hypothetical protein
LWAPAAGAGHFDIFMAESGGQVVTGGYDFDDNEVVETRIFEAEMQAELGQFVADEPGVVSGNPSPSTMPAGWSPLPSVPPRNVGFNLLTTLGYNLLFWDGIGDDVNDVTLGPVGGSEVMVVKQTGCFLCSTAVADGGASPVAGFVFDTTASPVHEHPEFFLLGDATPTPDAVTQGVYVLTWQATVQGLAASDPLWIVFGAFDPDSFPDLTPEEFDEFLEGRIELAASYIELNVIPEPGTLLLLGAGLLGLAAHGRRA